MITDQWYLACLLDELDVTNPLKKIIVGHNLVIFRTTQGKIGVIEDRCCHRNVQLSLGYIKGESIKCAYHGWEYNTDGACTCIPSLPADGAVPRIARVKKYPIQEKYRSVWVWIGDESKKDTIALPPMQEMDELPYVYNYHTVNAELPLVAESLIDAYHINHVHRNSIKTFMGNLYGEVTDFNLNIEDAALTGTYQRHFDSSIWEKLYFGFDKKVTTHIGFWFPHTSKLDIVFRKRRMVIYEHFYQVDENTVSMCQITLWKNIFSEFPLPFFAKGFMLRKSNRIVEEDLVFLENNKAVKQSTGKRDLLIPSDTVTFEFTKLWNRNTNKHESHPQEKDTP